MPLLSLFFWRPNFVPSLGPPSSNSLAQQHPHFFTPLGSHLSQVVLFLILISHPSLSGLTFTCAKVSGAAGTQAYLGPICRKERAEGVLAGGEGQGKRATTPGEGKLPAAPGWPSGISSFCSSYQVP